MMGVIPVLMTIANWEYDEKACRNPCGKQRGGKTFGGYGLEHHFLSRPELRLPYYCCDKQLLSTSA